MQNTRGYDPRDVSDVVGRRRLRAGAEGPDLRVEPDVTSADGTLELFGPPDLLIGPLRHADRFDVPVDRLADDLIGELRPRGPERLDLHGCARHQGGAVGDVDELVVRLFGGRAGGVAHEPPDLPRVSDDVGLNATHRDRTMRAVRRPQMLAELVEADVHEDDGVDSVLAVPR